MQQVKTHVSTLQIALERLKTSRPFLVADANFNAFENELANLAEYVFTLGGSDNDDTSSTVKSEASPLPSPHAAIPSTPSPSSIPTQAVSPDASVPASPDAPTLPPVVNPITPAAPTLPDTAPTLPDTAPSSIQPEPGKPS